MRVAETLADIPAKTLSERREGRAVGEEQEDEDDDDEKNRAVEGFKESHFFFFLLFVLLRGQGHLQG